MSKPWLDHYPPNVPAEIGPLPHATLGALMEAACAAHKDRAAFENMGVSLTYGDLDRISRNLAAYLLSLDLKKGSRVAIMMPNVLQYPVALMAILRAGLVVVNVNPLYTPRELAHQLADSGAEAIIVLDHFASNLEEALKDTSVRHVIVTGVGDLLGLKGVGINLVLRYIKKMVPDWTISQAISFNKALRSGKRKPLKPFETGPDDIALLQYTGGTTGIPKGAMLLHRNMVSEAYQCLAWIKTAYINRPRPAVTALVCALPLYHVYAMTVNGLVGMLLGGTNLLITNPRDIPAFVAALEKFPFSIIVGINTLFNALLHNKTFRTLDFSGLDLALAGGMALQKSVADRWKALTGHTIFVGYGLSETSPVVIANRFDAQDFTPAIGLPLPSTEIRLCDDDGNQVPTGEAGEIQVRGPQVMAGYWNRPEETAAVMTSDGFFKTGDIGVMDEKGSFTLVDRKKDMILVSGFNVYPNEIEDIVAMHPGVQEVAAIGVPDANAGEVPKIFVVRKDPDLTIAELNRYCRENLTGYKRPRHIEFRDSLPKTNVGKILRRELR